MNNKTLKILLVIAAIVVLAVVGLVVWHATDPNMPMPNATMMPTAMS